MKTLKNFKKDKVELKNVSGGKAGPQVKNSGCIPPVGGPGSTVYDWPDNDENEK